MSSEIIERYIGTECWITLSTFFGSAVVGKIINANEKWIEMETKRGNHLINIDFIQSIREIKYRNKKHQ